MEKVKHKNRGECTIWGEFVEYLILVDANGNKFEASKEELRDTDAGGGINVVQADFATIQPTQRTSEVQIDINDKNLSANALAMAIKGIGRVFAKGIIENRPVTGYKDYPHLEVVLKSNGINITSATLDALKSDGSIVFGDSEKAGLLTP
jgi:DNA uptake protein ComE-like DNA-binding protein